MKQTRIDAFFDRKKLHERELKDAEDYLGKCIQTKEVSN